MNNVDDEITSPNNDSAIRNFIISRKMKNRYVCQQKPVSARIVIHYTVQYRGISPYYLYSSNMLIYLCKLVHNCFSSSFIHIKEKLTHLEILLDILNRLALTNHPRCA